MSDRRLGMITPSSNTVLEPVCAAVTVPLDGVSVHFARVPVTEISLKPRALGQFDPAPMLAAARLLADAKVDVICWNGTSAGWLGLDSDRALCRAITDETGIPATTSMLALDEILAGAGHRRLGLVTPYEDPVQVAIVAAFEGQGIDCAAEEHCGLTVNHAFAGIEAGTIEGMIRRVAAAGPDAVAVICTNMKAAPLVARLEAELGLPIYDSVLTALWSSFRLAGVATGVSGWGRLLAGR